MSNISTDLSLQDGKACIELISRRFGVPWRAVTIGPLATSMCMFHQERFRSYGIYKNWQHDFCFPCFSRVIASGQMRSYGAGYLAQRTFKHWSQG